MSLKHRHRIPAWSVFLLGFAVGCGQSEDVKQEQEGHMQAAYGREQVASPRLTAKQKRLREERLRMQYGDMAR